MDIFGLVDVPIWLLGTVTTLIIFYLWQTWSHNYFKAQGIPGPRSFPIIGTSLGTLLRGPLEEIRLLSYGKTVALVTGTRPTLWTSNENILREVMVKDFDTFPQRGDSLSDDMSSHMVINKTGEGWRRIRNLLSPTFTGAKLKQMNGLINHCANMLVKNLTEQAALNDSLEMKQYCGAFSMDVIASTAFGLQIDSQKDVNNPFIKMALKVFQRPLYKNPAFFQRLFPFTRSIFKALKIPFFPKDSAKFFTDIVNRTIKERNEQPVKRSDFLQLLMNAEKESGQENGHINGKANGSYKGLSRKEMVANSLVFFLAGYETTGTTLSLFLYNLALFPEEQEKLYDEVKEFFQTTDNVDYNKLCELPYLEQCIYESLRMYPPATRTLRKCMADTEIEGIHIGKNMFVMVPIYGMHHDPDIYPDPHLFKPERFSAEGKAKRSPYHYMPFGYGPRNCLGMRLAMTEIKIAAAYLVYNFKFKPSDKTEVPISFRSSPLLSTKKGIFLNVEPRSIE